MKLLSAQQISEWDAYTIRQESVSTDVLMERAATAVANWCFSRNWKDRSFYIFCGKGNNGGDGLAVARLLHEAGYAVSVYVLEFGRMGSDDFQINLQRLHDIAFTSLFYLQSADAVPNIQKDNIILDALFGSGLNRPLTGLSVDVVNAINKSEALTVAIDVPSGLYPDRSSVNNTVVEADYTVSFEAYKIGLLVQENAPFIGEVTVLPIGLHPGYLKTITIDQELIDRAYIQSLFKPRNSFGHKGSFGHVLLIGGGYGKMGAMVLSTNACLYCGAGLTTVYIPKCGYQIMQTALPEAMVLTDEENNHLSKTPEGIDKFSVIGIGPGMGTEAATQEVLANIIRQYKKPMVIDADGLNGLARQQELLQLLPSQSIITPHPKEFDRLFGEHSDDFSRIATARNKAKEFSLVIVLKSHHTLIALPNGRAFFNSTGNAGMAKGGSGDVLTGIIASLVAQQYSPEEAALLGVYIHGLAGDKAAAVFSKEAMLPSHLISCLPKVFLGFE